VQLQLAAAAACGLAWRSPAAAAAESHQRPQGHLPPLALLLPAVCPLPLAAPHLLVLLLLLVVVGVRCWLCLPSCCWHHRWRRLLVRLLRLWLLHSCWLLGCHTLLLVMVLLLAQALCCWWCPCCSPPRSQPACCCSGPQSC
jgi:hypothetical protein